MKILMLFISYFTFFPPSNQKEVDLKIESDKKIYHVGDTIKLKITFDNKTNDDLSIAFRKGGFHFRQLSISQNENKLKPVGICREKIAPLGFLESDYHKINSKDRLIFNLNLELVNFPIKRNCFNEQFIKSGHGIICNSRGLQFNNFDELKVILEYNVKFPNSEKESINSAYHKKNNVLNQSLNSNIISIEIEN